MDTDTLDRRIRAAANLAVHGATSGERRAAQKALQRLRRRRDALQAKQRTALPEVFREALDSCATPQERHACLVGMAACLKWIQGDLPGSPFDLTSGELDRLTRLANAVSAAADHIEARAPTPTSGA